MDFSRSPGVFAVLVLLVGWVGFTAAPLAAGTITGRVRAQSATPTAGGADGGAYSTRRYKFLEKIDYTSLRDFVVHIDKVEHPPRADEPPPTSVVVQRDGEFIPHVLPIVAGTVVEWPNADDVFHNVFCMSETTPFDLGLYKRGNDAKSVVFPKTGRMDVFCSIHTKMSCIVLVLPNPWFARANEAGYYKITNVPAGTYQLRAWHERLPSKTREVVVPTEGEVQVDFVLGLGAAGRNE